MNTIISLGNKAIAAARDAGPQISEGASRLSEGATSVARGTRAVWNQLSPAGKGLLIMDVVAAALVVTGSIMGHYGMDGSATIRDVGMILLTAPTLCLILATGLLQIKKKLSHQDPATAPLNPAGGGIWSSMKNSEKGLFIMGILTSIVFMSLLCTNACSNFANNSDLSAKLGDITGYTVTTGIALTLITWIGLKLKERYDESHQQAINP